MNSAAASSPLTPRKLAFRDSVAFATLSLVTATLFGITLLLFRSFEEHRKRVGQQWSITGRTLLSEARAPEAVDALRTALSFQPDDRDNQLLLAQALAQSGKTEEATNYYLALWESRPGDGNVNLQLARLSRTSGKDSEATKYYRAAIFGTWEGDGINRRRDTRLELADYLIERGQKAAARAEILIAAGNNPETAPFDLSLAERLRNIGDTEDAMSFFLRAAALEPSNSRAWEEAGRSAFALDRFDDASRYLRRAVTHWPSDGDETRKSEVQSLANDSARARELNLSDDLAPEIRTKHILQASTLAQKRVASCLATLVEKSVAAAKRPQAVPADILALNNKWSQENLNLTSKTLQADAALQDQIVKLVFDSETLTSSSCGAPQADDAIALATSRASLQATQ